jgi:hypothetical protein
VCWPLLCLCRLFFIFERCLDLNPESCHLLLSYIFNLFKKDIDTYTRNLVGSVLLAVTTFGTVLLLALRPIPHSLEEKTASDSLEAKTEAVGTKCGTKMFRRK